MDFELHGHRHADLIFEGREEYRVLWDEVCDAIVSITDEQIIEEFESSTRQAKSISEALNRLIKKGLTERKWTPESFIFADRRYQEGCGSAKGIWRLDFAKDKLCIEVAFNHRSDISWNLLKPTVASELNHVQKAIQTDGGIIIAATEGLKSAGGFDRAVGTYEDYVQYLKPFRQILTAPLMIVGLEPPKTFRIDVVDHGPRHKVGRVVRI